MKDVPEILEDMAVTFRTRGKIYGDNYKKIGKVMEIFFPGGVKIESVEEHNRWHLFIMLIVKISRLAETNIKHKDSAHDLAVYGAMLESLIDDGVRE